ncbi:MAG: helix-turn-helix domain-containing protein [Erysipelotrichaceae bacterium]|jgi:hypothetical protein|nr:helix-turn-helix domain-containing protein [Erysipelotrichaceae bacterium]
MVLLGKQFDESPAAIVTNKDFLVVFHLLSQSNPLSGIHLEKLTGLKIKTIKRIITIFNGNIANSGLEIAAATGSGYSVVVQDEEKAKEFKRTFFIRYNRNLYFDDNANEFIHFFIRLILFRKEGIFIADIAEKTFYSISKINHDIIQVKRIFQRYQLYLQNHTNKGLQIAGNEWNIRMLMLYEHKVFLNFPRNLLSDEWEFEKWFLPGSDVFSSISSIFKQKLSQYQLVIPFNIVIRAVNLIVLSVTRRKYRDELVFSNESKAYHQKTATYHFCEDLYSTLSSLLDVVDYDERDILSLTAFLNCHVLEVKDDFRSFSDYLSLRRLANEFVNCLHQLIPVNHFSNLPVLKEWLTKYLITFTNRYRLSLPLDSEDYRRVEKDGLINLKFCNILYDFLKQNGYPLIRAVDAISFYDLFVSFLLENETPVVLRVFLVSGKGSRFVQVTKQRIETLYSQIGFSFFVSNQTFISKEEKQNMSKHYDLVVTDLPEFETRNITIPVFYLYDNKHSSDYEPLAQILNTLTRLDPRSCFTPQDFYHTSLFDKEDFYRWVKEHFANEIEPDAYLQDLKNQEDFLAFTRKNNLCLVSSLRDFFHRTFIKVLINDRQLKWGDAFCQLIVIYNVAGNDINQLKTIGAYLVNFLNNDNVVKIQNGQAGYQEVLALFET